MGQVFAWNPSIAGTKSEDTILAGESGNEILTAMDGWLTVTAYEGTVAGTPWGTQWGHPLPIV
ncbi:MAG: hypothetical protein RRC07_02300 [Anaerolineae bacterium]|nr:hypothetical protein [Anaerolineae bacterium]